MAEIRVDVRLTNSKNIKVERRTNMPQRILVTNCLRRGKVRRLVIPHLVILFLAQVLSATSLQTNFDDSAEETTTISSTPNNQMSNEPAIEVTTDEAMQQRINTTHPLFVNPKSAPVLRPSLEDVASKLSKKHLNLEHRNWRLKSAQHASSESTTELTAENATKNGGDTVVAGEEGQDIVKIPNGKFTSHKLNSELPEYFLSGSNADERNGSQTVSADPVVLSLAPQGQASDAKKRRPTSGRRKKQMTNADYEDNELYQCNQYLQQHSLASSSTSSSSRLATSPVLMDSLSRIMSNSQLLPCTCESRTHFTSQEDSDTSQIAKNQVDVWLSCDYVQLMGSHFYKTTGARQNDSRHQSDKSERTSTPLLITRFSQRDSGLQALHSQKFYYLQLSRLKSVDLSNNRIRQIKLDAFHGLELRLEHLNLADNLLGDSRAIFQGPQMSPRNRRSNDDVNSMIFLSEELNRLKSLKWLSLRNNQISQLGPNVFANAHNAAELSSSQLVYLDLSDNLLKSIPSDALNDLDSLKTLKLNGNKIFQLDHASNLPRSLRYLDLSGNLIKTIHHCNLVDLPNLIELNLSHNQLSHLDKTAFVSSSSLLVSRTQQQVEVGAETGSIVKLHSSFHTGQSYLLGDKLTMVLSNRDGSSSEESSLLGDASQSRLRRNADDEKTEDPKEEDDNEEPAESIAAQVSDSIDDLEASESILISQQSTVNDAMNTAQQQPANSQFNATLKLNLSYNMFENLPGDSLLKFPNLQQLDISHNRIRKLDSNYLCSIYNLVDNLRSLDLSGNLLSMEQSSRIPSNGSEKVQDDHALWLNRMFGCLLRIEKLYLSTNLLSPHRIQWHSGVDESLDPAEVSYDEKDDPAGDDGEARKTSNFFTDQLPRLVIRIGDGFGNKHLQTLDLSDNRLTSMPLIEQVLQSTTTNLTNEIGSQQIQLNQWVNSRIYLESLNLNYNFIERLDEQDFEFLFNLRQLTMDFNKLSNLPVKLMRRFTSLDRLSLDGNKISSLDPFNELFERSAKTLRYLSIANNRISEWPQVNKQIMAEKLAVYHTANLYHDEKDFFVFDSHDHGQTHAPKASFSFALEELNLEGNLLTSDNVTALFDQLIYMKSLRTLNLSYNLLQRVKSEWFKFANRSLSTLLLTGNNINNIDLGSFAPNQVDELVKLSLDFNLIKELKRKTFDTMPKIRELNLGNNMIHTINAETFHQLNSLAILKLNNNKLTCWKCEYFSNFCNSISGSINVDILTLLGSSHQRSSSSMSSLIELDLSHNSLSQLRGNSISVHTKLIRLNLSHNKLSFIPHDLFKATATGSASGRQVQLVSSLRYLNLANNRIQTIDNINFRPLKNLVSLDLAHNELQTIGFDVISSETDFNGKQHSNSTSELASSEFSSRTNTKRVDKFVSQAGTSNWPSLSKLRHLNLANNQLIMINQSILAELSPFALLNLNFSQNYLESETLPGGFYTKINGASPNLKSLHSLHPSSGYEHDKDIDSNAENHYDLVFTLKLESLDLSHNRLNEFPLHLLDNHYNSIESCNLAHNRIQALTPNSNSIVQIKSLNLELNPLNRESNELLLYERKSVRYLNLAATRLYAIHQASSDEGLGGYKRNATSITELDLIRSISKPIDAPYIRHLNLSSNQLVWLAANVFDKMHSLQSLDLSNNQLTRLHLLNNQLVHVSSTLEYLNMANNLFTSVDSNDFNQLTKLKHLDLSSLLSLRKLNCRFLSRLTSLQSLKMFNYPQLRHSLVSLVRTLDAASNNTQQATLSERMQRRLRIELIMSTVGKHCLQEETLIGQKQGTEISSSEKMMAKPSWLNLDELELELFNNFDRYSASGAFVLHDELAQFIGPKLNKLSLVGLNLTSLSDNSLFGVTNTDLSLKISYTSMSQLPLSQISKSVARRTKIDLDFRHNNIQSIDTETLQLLRELQLNHPFSQQRVTLRLGSNPIRCDCQTRPLWLWLNQRWPSDSFDHNSTEIPNDATSYLSSTQSNSNHWLKFRSITHTSDLNCYYPQKLRGKLAHHVNYNELVCRSESQPTIASIYRQARKRNGTRASDSYYMSALGNGDSKGDELEADPDYEELALTNLDPATTADLVKVTKFNRFPVTQTNTSWYYLNSLAITRPSNKDEDFLDLQLTSGEENMVRGKKQRRDHSASAQNNGFPIESEHGDSSVQQEMVNTNYNKYRPNSLQKHSHFNTLNAFSQIALASKRASAKLLTESDLLILTVASIVMVIMCFIIISICLLKYKMDQSDKEQIFGAKQFTRDKLAVAQAMTMMQHVSEKQVTKADLKACLRQSKQAGSKSSSTSSKSSKKTAVKTLKSNPMIGKLVDGQEISGGQVLIPMTAAPITVANNFLMRSPTIRRVHVLATNASDWFRFTLRAHPQPTTCSGRKSLFIGNNLPTSGSQLTTAQMIEPTSSCKVDSKRLANLLPTHLASGCPVHTFAGVIKMLNAPASRGERELASQCLHCSRLLNAIKRSSCLQDRVNSSSETTSSSSSNNQAAVVGNGENTGPSRKQGVKEDILSPGSSIVQRGGRLRTFGAPSNAASWATSAKESAGSEVDKHLPPSQIPTIDVEGRFTYQSESQLESTAYADRSIVSQTDISRGENTCSSLAADQYRDEIFILMRESPIDADQRPVDEQHPAACESVSVVNDGDECSRTSSPIAYGFMRPSPSVTTLSSNTRNVASSRIGGSTNTKDDDVRTEPGRAQCDDSERQPEDQIIISRL